MKTRKVLTLTLVLSLALLGASAPAAARGASDASAASFVHEIAPATLVFAVPFSVRLDTSLATIAGQAAITICGGSASAASW